MKTRAKSLRGQRIDESEHSLIGNQPGKLGEFVRWHSRGHARGKGEMDAVQAFIVSFPLALGQSHLVAPAARSSGLSIAIMLYYFAPPLQSYSAAVSLRIHAGAPCLLN